MFRAVEPTAEAKTHGGGKVTITGPAVPLMEEIDCASAGGCGKGTFLYLANGWLRYDSPAQPLLVVWINVARGTMRRTSWLAEKTPGHIMTESTNVHPAVVQLNDRCLVGPHVTTMRKVGQCLAAREHGLTADFTRGMVVFGTNEWSRDFSLMTGNFTGDGYGGSEDVDAMLAAIVAAAHGEKSVA